MVRLIINKKFYLKGILILAILIFSSQFSKAEILIFKNCKNNNYTYEKNEYILDLNKGMMTREFIYDNKSYKKIRSNDITAKKKNITTKGVTKVNGLIVSEIAGYPAFYTQLIFNDVEKSIKIKTVLNNTEGVSLISKCQKIIKFKKQA